MKTKVFDNLLLKVLSVAAAVILWLVVVRSEEHTSELQSHLT